MTDQALYVSRAQHDLGHITDFDILAVARTKNAPLNLSGFLFRSPNYFVQVLEGPSHNVAEVMGAIRTDPRHSVITEFQTLTVSRRLFPSWDMGYGPLPQDDQFARLLMDSPSAATRTALLGGLLTAYAEQDEGWENAVRNKLSGR